MYLRPRRRSGKVVRRPTAQPTRRRSNDRGKTARGAAFLWESNAFPNGCFLFGAFTVSHSNIASVRGYILNQRENHRTRTVEEELMELLKRHHIEFDTRYLFEAEHQG